MRIGIYGLPASGKSTVFQALSGCKVEITGKQRYSDPNRAIVKVPDKRLDRLDSFFTRNKKINATIEYLEVAAMQKSGSSHAMSDSLLGTLRSMEALAQVVRFFPAADVAHVHGTIDPLRDINEARSELLLSDLAVVENSLDRIERSLKGGKEQELLRKKELLHKCRETLEQEKTIRSIELTDDEKEILKNYQFLTQKPQMIILNADENQQTDELLIKIRQLIKNDPQTSISVICGKLEMELAQLEGEEQSMFLEELGIEEPALYRFIGQSFELLNLIVFFTIGDDEVRAWTLTKDSNALAAAGKIHSDLARGFIRAEVFHYNEFIEAGSESKLRTMGKIRLEGKNYVVQDGDILYIRFNVKK